MTAPLPTSCVSSDSAEHRRSGLLLAAVGTVFGTIGTAPLYAMKEAFAGTHPLAPDRLHVMGVLSLLFWALLIVATLKYVAVMLRADNRGEGGSLALQVLVQRAAEGRARLAAVVGTLGVFAAALFYANSMIAPAISALSVAEGIPTAAPQYAAYVLPAAIALVLGLFLVARHVSAVAAAMFGPVMLLWFVVLAALGIRAIAGAPEVLAAVSPHYALSFLVHDGWAGFLAVGSVVLVLGGCEALYAEMGMFGRLPIRLAWYLTVWPALVLNYFGQGALLLAHPRAAADPFFHLAPAWAGGPLLALSAAVVVIAGLAVIRGTFSLTRQAIQLGFLPRMEIIHASEKEIADIYMPFVNWMLMLACLGLVAGAESSRRLASAYGVAASSSMLIGTLLLALVMTLLWGWRGRKTAILVALFLLADCAFFVANSTKIPYGGWLPLAVGAVIFVVLVTWKSGRALLLRRLREDAMPVEDFLASLSDRVARVPGTAIFLTSTREGIPLALLHNLKHNKCIHERVVICTVIMGEMPFVPAEQRLEAIELAPNFLRLVIRYGFMEDTNIPKALAQARTDHLGFFYEPMSISYFVSRETLIPSSKPGMALWREHLFAWLARTATSAMDFFHLPTNRVVELGSQIEL